MSDPPPPPQVSPDGKFYWDGTRWVPMQQAPQAPQQVVPTPAQRQSQNVGCVTRTTCLTVVGLFVAVALVLLIAGVCSSIHR
jgi:hypothetical protein